MPTFTISRAPAVSRKIRIIISLGLLVGLSGFAAHPVNAAGVTHTFNVNTTADTHDVTPGDGICNDFTGHCSLRAASEEANAGISGDTYNITVPAGTYQESGPYGEISFTKTFTNVLAGGASSTVVRGVGCGSVGSHRVFSISTSAIVGIRGLKITSGCAPNDGGGIYDLGTLTLVSDVITANTAISGGGIYVSAPDCDNPVIINSSTISENVAGSFNADGTVATLGSGGGIYNSCANVSTQSTNFLHNVASDYGGALYNDEEASIQGGTISRNASKYGGAIYGDYSGTTIDNVYATFNSATYRGGFAYADSENRFNLSNSHVTDNASGEYGGALYNQATAASVNGTMLARNLAGCTAATSALAPVKHAPSAPRQFAITSVSAKPPTTTGAPAGIPVGIQPCTVANGIFSGGGGAIYDGDTDHTQMYTDVFSGNKAQGGNGFGGAVYNNGYESITNTHFFGNVAGTGTGSAGGGDGGGALYNDNYSAISNSFIQGNSTNAYGGGIFDDSGTDGALGLNQTIVNGNSAAIQTGGIYAPYNYVSLFNSPVGSNSAPPPCINLYENGGAICQ